MMGQNQLGRKRIVFQQMVMEQLDIHIFKKIYLDIDLTFYIKINSKYIIDLNIKYKISKILEESIGENLDDLGFKDSFSDTTSSENLKN